MSGRSGRWAGILLAATALTGGLVASRPAAAQDAAQLQAIQAQISQLQAQLRRLQREAAARDAALRRAQEDAAQARTQASQAMQRAQATPLAPTYPPGGYAQGPGGSIASLVVPPSAAPGSALVTIPPNDKDASGQLFYNPKKPNGQFNIGGVTVTLGGYIDTTVLYRSRNLTAGTSTSFNAIPYSNSVNAHLDEFRFTAQPSRFSILVQGKPTAEISLAGYFEGDFNGAATSSNSNQTNSYTPRMRLAYAQYDDARYGLHALFGQEWSLAVGDTVGITPRKENIPSTIDANYVPGFVYTRAPQVRLVKDFGSKFWLGLSLEAPQETYSFAGATTSTTVPNLVLPNGRSLTFNSLGTSYLNSTASYSYDTAPDIILKAAADPGFGHYEAYGLGSFFKARTSVVGAGDTRTVFGGGIGGSAVIPIVANFVDLTGNVLAGYGIGRYGASQLPDATFKANGEPAPLPEIIGMAGIVAHPSKAVDLYTYVGTEQIGRSSFTAGTGSKTAGFGYGTSFVNNTGCSIELDSSSLCSAQTRAVDGVTAGAWWRFLHGGYGTLMAGAEYSYIKKIAFHGVGGRPETDENMVFFTLRYLPFQ